jgi:general stress protein 26
MNAPTKVYLLVRTVKIMQDIKYKMMLWFEGADKYYPLGGTGPDYSVLCPTTRWGN